MVEPVAGLAAQLLCFKPPHPEKLCGRGWPRADSKGLIVGINVWEKVFTKINELILVFYLISIVTSYAPKTMILRFPCASRSSHLPFILPSIPDTYFWLVVVWKIVDRQQPKAKAPPKSLFFSSFHLVAPNDGTTPQRNPTRSRLLFNVPFISSADSQWLGTGDVWRSDKKVSNATLKNKKIIL